MTAPPDRLSSSLGTTQPIEFTIKWQQTKADEAKWMAALAGQIEDPSQAVAIGAC
jgi:hypothetical protein